MTTLTCSVDRCAGKHKGHGYCNKHYQQWKAHGEVRHYPETAPERFWLKVNKTDECWLWMASTFSNGYGQFTGENRVNGTAHKFSYELANGPVPKGMYIDHICSIRACVNPDHLRLVTPKQNTEHRTGPNKDSTTGVLGVSWIASRKSWKGTAKHGGRTYLAGYFSTLADAEAATVALRNELFTHNDMDRAA